MKKIFGFLFLLTVFGLANANPNNDCQDDVVKFNKFLGGFPYLVGYHAITKFGNVVSSSSNRGAICIAYVEELNGSPSGGYYVWDLIGTWSVGDTDINQVSLTEISSY